MTIRRFCAQISWTGITLLVYNVLHRTLYGFTKKQFYLHRACNIVFSRRLTIIAYIIYLKNYMIPYLYAEMFVCW